MSGGFVLVTGAAGGGPGSTGRWVAGLLLDRGVPVRAFVGAQDHRAEQLRQPGAEVAAGDPREIADVEPGAGNNRAAGTPHPRARLALPVVTRRPGFRERQGGRRRRGRWR